MARLIVYYVHPGQRFSRVNTAMAKAARAVGGITFVDLYAEYPRHDIDVNREQQRLLDHDVFLFQFPLYWYSTPSLLKEWQDLVLQHGFAYGHEGDRLSGKTMMLAITAGGPEEAYTPEGYQNFPLRVFLTPLEQTARLCGMSFAAPYVLYGAVREPKNEEIQEHARGYSALLCAIRDNLYDFTSAESRKIVQSDDLPVLQRS
ncbi:NAD(P)H-dependent oxidoreductase [uncultured Roseibium sp.]|uniref:NAD(P)H-dependent oxidoreductase n=1 Tax=uncultured Roseibium sp. TaxID=1936171 RepID=UPI002628594E|nr:NAD(P)H-dependent oxidoreductase [uncultured Roseibium sp.]